MVKMFDAYCNSGLYNLKTHVFDHIVKDTKTFGSLEILDRSSFELFNIQVKKIQPEFVKVIYMLERTCKYYVWASLVC